MTIETRDLGLSQCATSGQALRRLRRCRSTGARARSVSFTDAASGNTSRTLGSIATTFRPSAYRAAVAPRTPFEKSYSGRIVSRSTGRRDRLTFFFIRLPLPRSDPHTLDEHTAAVGE